MFQRALLPARTQRGDLQLDRNFFFLVVFEWDDLARVGREECRDIHIARIIGIMVIKNSELPPGDLRRKYKYRLVFQGNNVKDQNWQNAVFKDLGPLRRAWKRMGVFQVIPFSRQTLNGQLGQTGGSWGRLEPGGL